MLNTDQVILQVSAVYCNQAQLHSVPSPPLRYTEAPQMTRAITSAI